PGGVVDETSLGPRGRARAGPGPGRPAAARPREVLVHRHRTGQRAVERGERRRRRADRAAARAGLRGRPAAGRERRRTNHKATEEKETKEEIEHGLAERTGLRLLCSCVCSVSSVTLWLGILLMRRLCLLCCLLVPSAAAADLIPPEKAKADGDLLWYDAKLLGVEGQGFADVAATYDRLPAKAEKLVRKEVWGLSRHSAGLCVRFRTNATTIHARWTLTGKNPALPHMPATGVSGLDLYARAPSGKWQWLGVGRPTVTPTNTAVLARGLPTSEGREFILYLPLYNGVNSVEIGLP